MLTQGEAFDTLSLWRFFADKRLTTAGWDARDVVVICF